MSGANEQVVTRWFGTFRVDAHGAVREKLFPPDPRAWADRLRARRAGRLAPEEAELASTADAPGLVGTDRRLAPLGVKIRALASLPLVPLATPPRERLRELLLLEAERALEQSWDPSIHLQESVRAIEELDQTLNLVGERLRSWAERDVRELDDDEGEAVYPLAVRLVEGTESSNAKLAPPDPALVRSRTALARLYVELTRTRNEMEAALTEAVPRKAPNLAALLGPLLAARMIARAGGLERLARLPASTIQVLGAERAFFEHLRGRAPPPRHGLLFLHPEIQGRPRHERGKLARALAGKVAIASRLDYEGTPVRPELKEAFQARAQTIHKARKSKQSRGPRPTPST